MTKEQYLFLLRAELDGFLPPEELENILRYYSEYFEEAGPEQERNVMLELGSPQRLAQKILGRANGEDGAAYNPVETYDPAGGYYYDDPAGTQIPRWLLVILLGMAAVAVIPTFGGLVLGLGLGGLGCILGGIIAMVTGGFYFGLAGKIYVVGGGLIAFGVGLLLVAATAALVRVGVRVIRYCLEKLQEGSVNYHETGY